MNARGDSYHSLAETKGPGNVVGSTHACGNNDIIIFIGGNSIVVTIICRLLGRQKRIEDVYRIEERYSQT